MFRMPNVLVAGLDGSSASLAAARWAAHEAVLNGAALRLLQVSPTATTGRTSGRLPQEAPQEIRTALQRIAGELAAAHPDLEVTADTVVGDPLAELLRANVGASTLVLGARGAEGFDRLLLGSTALSVSARAQRPVVLVRDEPDTAEAWAGPVTVGVDPDQECVPVVEFALARAAERAAGLRAVHAWLPPRALAPTPAGPGGTGTATGDQDQLAGIQELETHLLRDAVERAAKEFPHVAVDYDLRAGSTGQILVDESERASLLVLGRPHHRAVSTLGPALHAAIHYSRCPVAIVPHL